MQEKTAGIRNYALTLLTFLALGLSVLLVRADMRSDLTTLSRYAAATTLSDPKSATGLITELDAQEGTMEQEGVGFELEAGSILRKANDFHTRVVARLPVSGLGILEFQYEPMSDAMILERVYNSDEDVCRNDRQGSGGLISANWSFFSSQIEIKVIHDAQLSAPYGTTCVPWNQPTFLDLDGDRQRFWTRSEIDAEASVVAAKWGLSGSRASGALGGLWAKYASEAIAVPILDSSLPVSLAAITLTFAAWVVGLMFVFFVRRQPSSMGSSATRNNALSRAVDSTEKLFWLLMSWSCLVLPVAVGLVAILVVLSEVRSGSYEYLVYVGCALSVLTVSVYIADQLLTFLTARRSMDIPDVEE